MKKKFIAIASLALFALIGASVNANGQEVRSAHAEESFVDGDWRVVKGGDTPFSVVGNTIVGGSSAWMSSFYVKEFDEAIGDYQVTIEYQGTMAFPNTKQVQFGIVPWYLDDSNYLVAYSEWSVETRISGMYNFNLTGRVDGGMPYRLDGSSYSAKEWDDIWMDGENDGFASPANAVNTLTITKTRSDDGNYDSFAFFFNGNALFNGVKHVRDTVKYSHRKASCGFYAYNDTFTITKFEVKQIENVDLYHAVEGSDGTANANYQINEGVISANVSNKVEPEEALFVDNQGIVEGSYGVEFEPSVTSHETKYGYGALIWHKDSYNYLGALVEKVGSQTNARFYGRTSISEEKVLSFKDINEVKPLDLDIESISKIRIEKRGLKVRLLLDGVEVAVYENKDCITSQQTGLIAYGCSLSFSGATKLNELSYIPYDWYSTTMNNRTTYISAKTDDAAAVSSSRNLYTVTDDAVTVGDKTQYTSIYYKSDSFAQMYITLCVTSVVTEDSVYGVYPWLEDTSSYFRVIVNSQKVIVEHTFGGAKVSEEYNLPSGYTFTSLENENRLLKVLLEYDNSVSISLGERDAENEEKWFDVETNGFTTDGRNNSISPNIGLLTASKGIKFRIESAKGFTPYAPRIEHDWELYGAMPDTWQYIDENTFKCSQTNGTQYMNAKALTSTAGETDFFMGATFTVTNASQAEHKAAFYPWFIDDNNYVIVMFSKWASNPNASIVFTGKINGRVLGGREWHDYATAYTFEGVANQLEIEISGNHIYAYLNGSTTPTQQVTFEGLSTRSVVNAKSGFFFYNCDVLIDEYQVVSHERIYASTEKPTIKYIGSVKDTGTVGTSVSIPTFYAENSAGDTLEVEIEVLDPNGNPVTLNKMKFVPEMEGKYHVKVMCVDNWGNEADPFEYDITITSGGNTPDKGDNKDGEQSEEKKKGCGGSIIAVSSIISITSLLGVGLLLKKRHE